MQLRPYQEKAIDIAHSFFTQNTPNSKLFFTLPTGTGKSYIPLELRKDFPNMWIVAPKVEILDGFLNKMGVESTNYLEYNLATPITLRNRLLEGIQLKIDQLVIDEGHHGSATSYQESDMMLGVPTLYLSATGFRASHKQTQKLHELCGTPIEILSYREAKEGGYIHIPDCVIMPLLDDDIISIENGEFVVDQVTSEYKTRLQDFFERTKHIYSEGVFDKSTIMCIPSRELGRHVMCTAPYPTAFINSDTPKKLRDIAFDQCEAKKIAIAFIDVISEGIDKKFSRLYDLNPTASPVRFLQRFGRITRMEDCEYICTNRNFIRHAYLLDGCIDVKKAIVEMSKFQVSIRIGSRAMGLESIGRFKAEPVQLQSGVVVGMYSLVQKVGNTVVKYCCVVHPLYKTAIWGCQQYVNTSWSKWMPCATPEALTGFTSAQKYTLTSKQLAFWNKCAASVGLDSTTIPDSKTFAILPFLLDLKVKIS